ncbi:MAG TPA: Lrp/AsnC ligand binding domain-containing protein [Caulobacteraceae bacterium]|jgi:DNA-binding Lrp family transcriptional regulator
MNTLFVMIKTELGRTNEVGDAIVNRGGEAVEVYSITGEHDLLVKARFREIEQVAEFVQRELHPLPGVRETHTFVSFQRYGDFPV